MDQGNEDNKVIAERNYLMKLIEEDFGGYSSKIFSICVDKHSGRPLYLTHIPIAISASRMGYKINEFQIECLNAGYVYMVSSYYCIDAFVDNHTWGDHSEFDKSLSIDISLLTSAAYKRFLEAVKSINPNKLDWLIVNFNYFLQQNSESLIQEQIYRADPFLEYNHDVEYLSMWGRSNPFLFIVILLSELGGNTLDDKIVECIKKMLYHLQWGDDIGDWREDLAQKKWTPFLRRCISMVGNKIDENKIEELIYLEGVLEEYLTNVINELKAVSLELGKFDYLGPLVEAINLQWKKAEKQVDKIIKLKQNNRIL